MRYDLTRDIVTTSLLKRLWSRIPISSDDACWEWEGARTPQGYGRISITRLDGTQHIEYAHRIVLMVAHNVDLPAGMVTIHSCDNPPCCNPAHIRLGTQSENCQDRENKRRHPRRTVEQRYGLSPTWVDEAAKMYQSGLTMAQVGQHFGVSPDTVSSRLMAIGIKARAGKSRYGTSHIHDKMQA